jgi:oligoribonuclease
MRRWKPSLCNGLVKKNTHKALDDIRESIEELIYYRDHFFVK